MVPAGVYAGFSNQAEGDTHVTHDMTLLTTTPVEDLQLVNTETGERREVETSVGWWPDQWGKHTLSRAVDGWVWFNEDGSPCNRNNPWRIERRAVDADAELTKLAVLRCEADRGGHVGRILQAHRAAVKAKAGDLSALDALILTPPVDPLEAEAAKIADNDIGVVREVYKYRPELASHKLVMAGIKRGIELAERGEG